MWESLSMYVSTVYTPYIMYWSVCVCVAFTLTISKSLSDSKIRVTFSLGYYYEHIITINIYANIYILHTLSYIKLNLKLPWSRSYLMIQVKFGWTMLKRQTSCLQTGSFPLWYRSPVLSVRLFQALGTDSFSSNNTWLIYTEKLWIQWFKKSYFQEAQNNQATTQCILLSVNAQIFWDCRVLGSESRELNDFKPSRIEGQTHRFSGKG